MSRCSDSHVKEIMDAIEADLSDRVEALMLLSAEEDKELFPPVFVRAAAALGHEDVVRVLVRTPPGCPADDGSYHPPIYWAARGGHAQVVRFLAEQEGVRLVDPRGRMHAPILVAAELGHTQTVATLLSCRGSAEARAQLLVDDPWCSSPLALACRHGHLHVVSILLAAGAPLDDCDVRGVTPRTLLNCNIFGRDVHHDPK